MAERNSKSPSWRRLDNAGKLFTVASNEKDTRVFRFYCVLKETIDPEDLQAALDKTLEIYPMFLSVMRRGLFWYYLEKSDLKAVVTEEYRAPCSNIYVHDKKSLLFHVTYYKTRINFEVYHALTDGTGATEFLRELVKNYILVHEKKENLPDRPLVDQHVTLHDLESDSFTKYYSEGMAKIPKKKIRAHQLHGPKQDDGNLFITEGRVSVQELLGVSRSYQVSMTVFLTAVYLKAIHDQMSKNQEKKPVVLMVPVNLRQFFPSESMLNFFGWIEPGYDFAKGSGEFEDILSSVKEYFKRELVEERVAMRMNAYTGLEKNKILRFAPLELKRLGIQLGSKLAAEEVTAIYSNMSVVKMPEEYEPYIDHFGVFTSTPKTEMCMCSFQDTLVLNFTSRYDSRNIHENFFKILGKLGIQVNRPEPEFPPDAEPAYAGKKFFQIVSFIAIAAAVICVMINAIFTPDSYWSVIAGGGLLSMWTALMIGFVKRRNLLKNVMSQLVLISLGSIVWDLAIGWHGWSLAFVFPGIVLLTILSMLIIRWVQKLHASFYMIYFLMAAGYGLIPFIFLLLRLVNVTFPSVLCSGISFLLLIGMWIFRRRELTKEMSKKFHV